jgi:hypothetical protein
MTEKRKRRQGGNPARRESDVPLAENKLSNSNSIAIRQAIGGV